MTFFGYDGADIPRCGNSPRSRALSAPVSRSAARSASSRAHSCGRRRLVRSALAALLLGCSASVLPGVVLAQVDLNAQGIESTMDAVEMGEEASQTSVGVTLSLEPSMNRTVMITNSDPGAVTVSPGSLTFTPENWSTEQSFNITPIQDADANDENVTLTLSGDGLTSTTVTVTIIDDDTAQVTGVTVDEGDAQLVVNWTAVDNATGYTVQWKSGGQGYNTDDRQATVTSGTTTSHTITGLTNGTEYSVQVSATRTSATDGLPSAAVQGTPAVPIAAGVITVSPTALTVTEEDATGDSYTVVLDSRPTADVTVTVAGHSGTDVTPDPGTLTFTTSNWDTIQTVMVTAGDDADTANDAVTLTHSAASTDTGYEGISIDGVAVTVTDNDAAKGVTVSTTALTVTEQDTTGGSYTVVLDSDPTATVTVTVAGHAGTDVTRTPGTLTFTTSNWDTVQTVTVTAGDDADTTDDSVTLTHSAASTDTGYSGITIAGVVVTVRDNDTAQVTGVTVDAVDAQLVVNWTAVDNATGYTVQWKSGGQGYNTGDRQATVTPGSTTHTIEGLANGTEYTVRVIATRTDANDGPPSAEVTGTTEMIPMPTPTLPEIALLLLAMLLLGSGVYLLRGRQSGGLTHA